jgi:glucose/arabinose dehydrogenase
MLTCLLLLAVAAAPDESTYYPIVVMEPPEGVVLEGGAVCLLEDGRLAVGTRRGEIWIVDQPEQGQPGPEAFHLFASGLHEPLGLAQRDGWLYVTQRPDITRIRDTDGDGLADDFEVFAEGWGVSGDYHEYAFGSPFDRDGNLWVALCLTGSFSSEVPFRGWAVRVTPDGNVVPTTSGLRSPGGIGMNQAGDVFYTDNQGPWNGTCSLKHLVPGKFVGHPDGNVWYAQAGPQMGQRPANPTSDSRIMAEAARIPELEPPAVMFPYVKMGQSASGIACDSSDGKFGPFHGQLFVGDQMQSIVMRVFLEQVQGHYQGACFPFRSGLSSGAVGMAFDPRGVLYVGTTARGWGSRGNREFSLERIDWSGKVPFEILEMRARPDGFQLVFTQPVDRDSATRLESYQLSTYTYIYRAEYGSPEVDQTEPRITAANVSDDGRQVDLQVEGLQRGHIHELHAAGVRNSDGLPLLHDTAYYTLNYLPTE